MGILKDFLRDALRGHPDATPALICFVAVTVGLLALAVGS